uniref:NHR domain-containing protein n=1 Tax=Knipowitschia caucasica TaxID=637954 RepID=A0AAV2JLP4_KNICA
MVSVDRLRPRTYASHRASMQRSRTDPRLSVSLCDLRLQPQYDADSDDEPPASSSSSSCHIPQNSQNSQQSSLLPPHLDTDLHFHPTHGAHTVILDKHTVARLDHRGDQRTLVFTSRPMRSSETVYVKVTKAGGARRPGALSYGVTSCDPSSLRPSDLPCEPESMVDRKEFWAVSRVGGYLQAGDILGLSVSAAGEVLMSHNGQSAAMKLCVDNSRPLWMFYGLHGVSQLRILGGWYFIESGNVSD